MEGLTGREEGAARATRAAREPMMDPMDADFDEAIASDYALVAERCEDELARMVLGNLAEEHRTMHRRVRQLERERRHVPTHDEEAA